MTLAMRGRLAGAGGPQQDLVLASAADAGHEALDGLGLVTGGLEGSDQLEVGHDPMIRASAAQIEHPFRVIRASAPGGRAAAAAVERGCGGVRGRKESYRPDPMGPWQPASAPRMLAAARTRRSAAGV